MAEAIYVENLDLIIRDLNRLGPVASRAMKVGLVEAAEPVRQDAERLSFRISGMKRARQKPPPWSIQRKGQTVHEVYVAPRERGVKSRMDRSRRRPNFAELMLSKSYEPALERNQVQVRNTVNIWLGKAVETI